jgi:hemin uptake protein HemP
MGDGSRITQTSMAIWEYKVISSGKGGFATPALLEKFLNDLGKEEWDLVHFQSPPDNPLAFTGLARRSTQRDWTLEDAAAAAARTEADKLRAEFEAKFKGAVSAAPAGAAEEKPETIAGEKVAADDGFRRVRDTGSDLDPDAPDEEPKDEWDMLTSENELPTFFEAIRPHMRRNQRGPGMSVGVDHLAKRWEMSDADVKGALLECGFAIPDDEDAAPVYIEYEGDLYWLNINRRGELWLNTKEKPRPVFRTVPGQRVAAEAATGGEGEGRGAGGAESAESGVPAGSDAGGALGTGDRGQGTRDGGRKPEDRGRKTDDRGRRPEGRGADVSSGAPSEPLPTGPALLEKVRPLMRRNRRGPGGSGSMSFLSRGLKCTEADLMAAFASLGLTLSAAGEKPVEVEIGAEVWWLNQDQRGGVWINGQEKGSGEGRGARGEEAADAKALADAQGTGGGAQESVPLFVPGAAATPPATSSAPEPGAVFAGVRLLLKETKTGAVAGKVDRLAEELAKPAEEFLATLTGAGLVVPEKARDKPVFIEHAGEIFWLNKNAKGELWLNAKVSKYADGEKKSAGRGRPAKKPAKE